MRGRRRQAGTSNSANSRCAVCRLPSLAGVHQLGNAATALAALKSLGVELEHANVSEALRGVKLAGRFQRVLDFERGAVEWILDVAHNVPAAMGLAANLRALPRVRTIAVCGILGDKDIAGHHRGARRADRRLDSRGSRGSARRVARRARATPAARRHDPCARAGRRRRLPHGARRGAARRTHSGVRIFPHGRTGARIPIWAIVRPWIREPSND